MTSLGPLTTPFVPSGSGCQSIHVGLTTQATFLEHGTISGCFPSNFKPQNAYFYSPGVCQVDYTYACSGDAGLPGVTVATCCPTGFTCRPNLIGGDPNACQSAFTTAGSLLVDVYTYSTLSPTYVGATTTYYKPGDIVFAKGLAVQRATSDPAWNTAMTGATEVVTTGTTTTGTGTQNTPTPPVNSDTTKKPSVDSSELSPGAKAGIGVGITVGAFLITLLVMIAYRCGKRRGRSSVKGELSGCSADGTWIGETKPIIEMEEQRRMQELRATRDPIELVG
ncbi:hypothetical protein F5Y10DRAFT_181340 [Nemania abortiva]|nr:hypothetical protein F5Y10DRAFT_181340 [Nemania abortiva]